MHGLRRIEHQEQAHDVGGLEPPVGRVLVFPHGAEARGGGVHRGFERGIDGGHVRHGLGRFPIVEGVLVETLDAGGLPEVAVNLGAFVRVAGLGCGLRAGGPGLFRGQIDGLLERHRLDHDLAQVRLPQHGHQVVVAVGGAPREPQGLEERVELAARGGGKNRHLAHAIAVEHERQLVEGPVLHPLLAGRVPGTHQHLVAESDLGGGEAEAHPAGP